MSVSLPGVGRIPLRNRHGAVVAYASVDLADFADVSQYRWHFNSRGYVIRHVRVAPGPKGEYCLSMHRHVLGLRRGDAPGMVVDHIDHDQLNNRRSNLRLGTVSQNQQNRIGPRSDSRCSSRGVSFDPRVSKWRARAQVAGKRYFLGEFPTESEAADAARAWRREHMPFAID